MFLNGDTFHNCLMEHNYEKNIHNKIFKYQGGIIIAFPYPSVEFVIFGLFSNVIYPWLKVICCFLNSGNLGELELGAQSILFQVEGTIYMVKYHCNRVYTRTCIGHVISYRCCL